MYPRSGYFLVITITPKTALSFCKNVVLYNTCTLSINVSLEVMEFRVSILKVHISEFKIFDCKPRN